MASFEVLGEQKKTLSNLPLLRFTSIVTVLVALDSLACISLWIAGGDSQYLENNVKQFSITRSTFDLACLAAVRGVVIIASYYYLEQFIIMKSSTRSSRKQVQSTRFSMFCQTVIILFSMASFVYSIVKGSLLIRRIVKKESLEMHITYKILCIASVAFSLIELLIGIISFYCIRKMVRERGLRLLINQDQGDEKPAKKRVDLRRLIWLARPEYPLLLAALFCLMVSAGSLSIAPFLFGKVINYAVPGQSNCTDKYGRDIPPNVTNCVPYTMERMNRMVVYLILVFVVGSIGVMARQILFNLAGERFVARLRKKLFSSIIQQEVGFYDQNRIGELTNRLSADTQVIQSAVTENMSMLTRFSMQALISIGLMFYVSAKLTAVLLSVVPVIVVSAVQYGRFLKGLKKNYQDELAKASSTAEESFGNILTVRSFSNEKRTIGSYSKDINASYKLGRKLSFLVGIFMGVVTLLLYAAAALVLWYGGYLVYHEDIQTGTLISLMLYTLNLAMCFALLSNVYGEFMQAVGASTRIFDLLDRVSEIRDGNQVLDHLKGEIIFDKVVFSYPSRPDEEVLKGVSFEMLPGQVVAVVGQSGGGKSTIVKLIEHFYEVSSGRILLSGCNVRQLDPEWFRKHIGLVSQEPVLFANTIAKNIAYGRENATTDEIREAAIQANAHNFIMSFEEGYDTMVGERGVRLSGGQKQRVAIARALLLNPEILLLDEATSALDAESEHLVQEAIDRAMKGRTVLVIAHRLSTVKNANMVMVMDRGRIVEQGTHDELIALNGVYKQLVIRQLEQ